MWHSMPENIINERNCKNTWCTCLMKKLEQEINFQRHIVKLENFLRLWRMMGLKIEEKFFLNPKKKYSTLSNSYKDSGLKDVDIFEKVNSLQYLQAKRLFNENFLTEHFQISKIKPVSSRQTFAKMLKFQPFLELVQGQWKFYQPL